MIRILESKPFWRKGFGERFNVSIFFKIYIIYRAAIYILNILSKSVKRVKQGLKAFVYKGFERFS